jgi:YesN/AraC family two-component response regulator
MPRKGGLEMRRELAEIAPNARFLFMSGYTESNIFASEVGGQTLEFISKPLNREKLSIKLRQILDAPFQPLVDSRRTA